MNELPWFAPLWQKLASDLNSRLPHALLFVGVPGIGKRQFGEALAASILCQTPISQRPSAVACGHCPSCVWRDSGNHPDLLRIIPEADEEGAASGDKKASTQIKIQQIREVQQNLTLSAHGERGRVIIISPAEAMNNITANALLKILEEPPSATLFMLFSSNARLLLPTLRSRCQEWLMATPERALARDWLIQQQGGFAAADIDTMLALHSGAPLATRQSLQTGWPSLLNNFVADMKALPNGSAISLAATWESRLRSKEHQEKHFTAADLINWVIAWLGDLTRSRLGAEVVFFPMQQKVLEQIALGLHPPAMFHCYDELLRFKASAEHPLNMRLMLEDLFIRFRRVFSGD